MPAERPHGFDEWIVAMGPHTPFLVGTQDLVTDMSRGPEHHINEYRRAYRGYMASRSGPEASIHLAHAAIHLAHAVRRAVEDQSGRVSFTGLEMAIDKALGSGPRKRFRRIVTCGDRAMDLPLLDPSAFSKAPSLESVRAGIHDRDFVRFLQEVSVRLGRRDL